MSDSQPIADDEALLTVPQAAQLLGVHTTTVRRWILAGVLPGNRYRILQRSRIRISAQDVHHLRAAIRARSVMDDDAAELLEWMAKSRTDHVGVCPRCGSARIDPDSPHDWCTGCTVEHQIAEDEKRDRERARQRRWWDENGQQWREGRKPPSAGDLAGVLERMAEIVPQADES